MAGSADVITSDGEPPVMTRSVVDPWCGRIVELAARVLPAQQRQRYALEFIAELYGMSRSQQLRHSVQVLTRSWALRAALTSAGPNQTSLEDSTMTTTTRKPWLCRLGLHRWDEYENPETKERYQLCQRCDAYHERPRAAPGAAGSGMTNGGGGMY
jgi:hypothetical protein